MTLVAFSLEHRRINVNIMTSLRQGMKLKTIICVLCHFPVDSCLKLPRFVREELNGAGLVLRDDIRCSSKGGQAVIYRVTGNSESSKLREAGKTTTEKAPHFLFHVSPLREHSIRQTKK